MQPGLLLVRGARARRVHRLPPAQVRPSVRPSRSVAQPKYVHSRDSRPALLLAFNVATSFRVSLPKTNAGVFMLLSCRCRLLMDGECVLGCPLGFYHVFEGDNVRCYECDATCAACVGAAAADCYSCNANYSLHDGACVRTCPPQYYTSEGVCTPCHYSCLTCSGEALDVTCSVACHKPTQQNNGRPAEPQPLSIISQLTSLLLFQVRGRRHAGAVEPATASPPAPASSSWLRRSRAAPPAASSSQTPT